MLIMANWGLAELRLAWNLLGKEKLLSLISHEIGVSANLIIGLFNIFF